MCGCRPRGLRALPLVTAPHFRRELGGGGASGAGDKEELPPASHAATGDAETGAEDSEGTGGRLGFPETQRPAPLPGQI